jgi:hypothetical protein
MLTEKVKEIAIDGRCSCGRSVTKLVHSIRPTPRTNGDRYIYPEQDDTGWDIFRCRSCGKPIDETWERLSEEANKP